MVTTLSTKFSYRNATRKHRYSHDGHLLLLHVMRVELLLLALLVILPSAAAEAGHSAEDELAGTCGCVRRSTPSSLLEGGCECHRAAPDRLSQGSLDAPLSTATRPSPRARARAYRCARMLLLSPASRTPVFNRPPTILPLPFPLPSPSPSCPPLLHLHHNPHPADLSQRRSSTSTTPRRRRLSTRRR